MELSRNFGHHPAAVAGLAHARGRRVFILDVDLEEQPEWLAGFAAQLDASGADVVYGSSRVRKGTLLRRAFGAMFWKLFNALSDVAVPENPCTVRIMSRRYVDALLTLPDRNLFLAGSYAWLGFRQEPRPVEKGLRRTASTYTARKLVALDERAADALAEALLALAALPRPCHPVAGERRLGGLRQGAAYTIVGSRADSTPCAPCSRCRVSTPDRGVEPPRRWTRSVGFVLEPWRARRRSAAATAGPSPGGVARRATPWPCPLVRPRAGLLDELHRLSAHDLALGHRRYFDLGSLRRLVEGAGLRAGACEGILLKCLTTDQLSRLGLDARVLEAFCEIGADYPEIASPPRRRSRGSRMATRATSRARASLPWPPARSGLEGARPGPLPGSPSGVRHPPVGGDEPSPRVARAIARRAVRPLAVAGERASRPSR